MLTVYTATRKDKISRFWKACLRDRQLIFLTFLPVIWYIVFCYIPMYGIQIAFKDFSPARGITGSEWIGFENFEQFFSSFYFWRLIRNTLLINVFSLIFGFPVPIIFAIMLNEIKSSKYRKFIQSVTYFPNFISTVVVVSLITMLFAANTGVLNLTGVLYGRDIAITNDPKYFRMLYIGSGIWQSFGFSSVLFLAAITGIDTQLFEAAEIDGATRIGRIWHIIIPCILPTIVIMLLMNLGNLFSQGPEKIILMYSPSTYEVADVISTYVYRVGLANMKYSFGTAVGLFNTLLNFIMLLVFNSLARRFGETSLW